MELTPRLTGDLAKIGLCAIGGLGILLNRKIIRPRIKSEKYNKISLPAEHALSHALLVMGMDGLNDLGLMTTGLLPSNLTNLISIYIAMAGSWSVGLVSDMIVPGEPRIVQLIANTIGCLAYGIPALLLGH